MEIDYVKRKIVLKFEVNRIKIVEETYATRFKSHILQTYALKREKWNFLFKSAQFPQKSTFFLSPTYFRTKYYAKTKNIWFYSLAQTVAP